MTGAVGGLGPGPGQPVDDVAPARRGQRPAHVLDGERGAQVAERQPLPQRPLTQRAEHERGPEDVTGPGGIVRVDRQRRYPLLLAGDGVHRDGALAAAGDHGDGHPAGQSVQSVVRVVGAGVGHRLHAVGQEGVEVLQLLQDGG
jgi:hypothetical protein